MNPARKTQHVSDSDPGSVLRALGVNSGYDLSDASFESSDQIEEASDLTAAVESIPLRINHDTLPSAEPDTESPFDAPFESAQQIQQLAIRLNEFELELEQRESELTARMRELDQAELQQQSLFEQQRSQIGQQSSQVRCQQLHLMQLQTDIVKSHEATRAAVEALVVPAESDQETLAAIKALKYELCGKFDYVARRWEHLAELMNRDRTQNAARQSTDDSVDWTSERS
jgi:hypothetical protein